MRSALVSSLLLFVPLDATWNVTADFLAWFPSEEVASIWADVISLGDNSSTWRAPGFNFDWDYGFRVGAGTTFGCDAWDTSLTWTSFYTAAKRTITPLPLTHMGPEFDAAFLSTDAPQEMRGRWSIHYNIFDWELGKKCWIGSCFSYRPFIGLRGGWIYQTIGVHYDDLIIHSIPTTFTGKEHLHNNFSGVGPSAGLNTQWFFSQLLYLFGDFSLATLWGNWAVNDTYVNTLHHSSTVRTKDSQLGALMFRGFMGIGFETKRFAIKLGYEGQLWFNQLRIATFQLQRLHNDLTLQGFTLNCRMDF